MLTYLLGGTLPDGTEITAKYIGSRRLMEIAVATLATDRALLLLGVPGTAKSWVSEHLSAAISGDSGLLVQDARGAAARAGVQQGDVLLAVNGTNVRSVDQVREVVAKSDKSVALLIQRGEQRIFVPIRLG